MSSKFRSAAAGGSIVISMRVYFSRYHIWAAAHFARTSGNIERERDDGFHLDHRAYVTGAIVESVSFLEAAINEFFTDASEDYSTPEWTGALPAAVLKRVGAMWGFVARASILDKYQAVLGLVGQTAYDPGLAPYQDVALLVGLRNHLVHFTPESLVAGAVDSHRFERQLRSKFQQNKLMAKAGNPYFPDKCLGCGAAKWAVESSLRFADDFFISRLNLKPNYDYIRSELSTTSPSK